MNTQYFPLISAFALSIICVIADYFLKRASEIDTPYYNYWFTVGFILEASTAFGWVYVMRHIKLATLGAISSVFIALLLVALGVIFFNETLDTKEIGSDAKCSDRIYLKSGKVRIDKTKNSSKMVDEFLRKS